MPKVIYTDSQGQRHTEEVPVGFTLMEGAFNQGLAGMVAECGGAAACGTCHCYLGDEWLTRVPPIADLEDSMLFMVENRSGNSRLACQIHMSDELDGIELQIADNE